MSLRETLFNPLIERGKAQSARFDALPLRERGASFAILVAVVIAVEALVVMPTQAKRELIERATVEQIQRLADEKLEAEQARSSHQSGLEQQLAAIDRELLQLGAGATAGQPLSFLLNRALARHEVSVVSLRELMVESIVAAAAPAALVAPEEPAAEASEAPTLYRHRFELTLGGQPRALIDALAALDRDARPMRIERVRVSGKDAPAVELAVTLTIVGTERSWLSI